MNVYREAARRREKIRDELSAKTQAAAQKSQRELTQQLGVSLSTVKRDLKKIRGPKSSHVSRAQGTNRPAVRSNPSVSKAMEKLEQRLDDIQLAQLRIVKLLEQIPELIENDRNLLTITNQAQAEQNRQYAELETLRDMIRTGSNRFLIDDLNNIRTN